VFNYRGALVLPCRITMRIMPGVVDIPQGAWYMPDDERVDHGGNVNILTSQRETPFAFGSTQHTIMVEIEKPTKRNQEPNTPDFLFALWLWVDNTDGLRISI
jgi:anaerobic dimethyl sulfoxide reductase subunit A